MNKTISLVISILITLGLAWVSLAYGTAKTEWSTVIHAFTHFDGSAEHLIIRNTRVPRVLIAMTVGASLAISGAILQTVTRNPIASPSIFGVNAGAALFIIISISWFGFTTLHEMIGAAFLGAAAAAGAAYGLGSAGRDGASPIKITLAGAAVTAFATSITQGIMLVNGGKFEQVIIWLVGSVAGRDLQMLLSVLPYMAAGWIASLALARPLNTLSLGEDVARGLGVRVGMLKLASVTAVVLLAGASVSVAGPIAFVGIIIPHIARFFTGGDHRWLLPYCAVFGAALLLAADVGARFIAMPKEVPVGVVTALIGVPVLVWIVRRRSYGS